MCSEYAHCLHWSLPCIVAGVYTRIVTIKCVVGITSNSGMCAGLLVWR